MAIPYFADIHCHPSMKPFRQVPEASIFEDIKAKDDCKKLNLLTRPAAREIVKDSQTNLNKCRQGRLRVVLASIYTPERKFFDLRDLFEFLLDNFFPNQTANLGVCMTGFDRSFINEYIDAHDKNKDVGIDYFGETQREYEYMVRQAAQHQDMSIAGDYYLQRVAETRILCGIKILNR